MVIDFDVVLLGQRLAKEINDQCHDQLFHCSDDMCLFAQLMVHPNLHSMGTGQESPKNGESFSSEYFSNHYLIDNFLMNTFQIVYGLIFLQ